MTQFTIFILFVLNVSASNNENDIYIVNDFNTELQSKWRGRDKNYGDIYNIVEYDYNNFLSAKSSNFANFIIREIEVVGSFVLQ